MGNATPHAPSSPFIALRNPFVATGAILCSLGIFISAYHLVSGTVHTTSEMFIMCLGLAFFLLGIALLASALEIAGDSAPDPGIPETFGALTALILVVVWSSEISNITVFAIAAGAIGGIAHEIAQSNGAIAYPQRQPGKNGGPPEIYLGTLGGVLLGAIAGVLVFSTSHQTGLSLGLTTFLAGLALKGVSEAATTSGTRSGGSNSGSGGTTPQTATGPTSTQVTGTPPAG